MSITAWDLGETIGTITVRWIDSQNSSGSLTPLGSFAVSSTITNSASFSPK